MTPTEKLREEWHVRTFNIANEVSDYSKVEMLIADWWIEKIHQAVAEERERMREGVIELMKKADGTFPVGFQSDVEDLLEAKEEIK